MNLKEFYEAQNVNSEEKQILLAKDVREIDERGRAIPFNDETEITEVIQNMFMKELAILRAQKVNVTRIRIPFGDMVVLYLQVAGAALIVFGIPALIFVLIRSTF